MKPSKCVCQHYSNYQDTEAQDDYMLRLPQIEPANSNHQDVSR